MYTYRDWVCLACDFLFRNDRGVIFLLPVISTSSSSAVSLKVYCDNVISVSRLLLRYRDWPML